MPPHPLHSPTEDSDSSLAGKSSDSIFPKKKPPKDNTTAAFLLDDEGDAGEDREEGSGEGSAETPDCEIDSYLSLQQVSASDNDGRDVNVLEWWKARNP
mmetsp:Transcript_37452/g.105754  ORF Transcript_37452/g.105754 Transcript_37452/m.105754 type:complete len:99 (-) Transcript_37452:332-628(-)